MLNPDFKEFLRLLNEHNVRYLVVGGYAVALHGYPRYTKDIDIWVWLDPENAERMIAALVRHPPKRKNTGMEAMKVAHSESMSVPTWIPNEPFFIESRLR